MRRWCCLPQKEERTKEREQLLWEKVQFQNRLRKQEAGQHDQIAKLEADAAKQRAMLQGVREQLDAVNDEVDEGTAVFLGSLVCNLRCVAGRRMVCSSMARSSKVSSTFLESEDSLRFVVGQRLMCCTMALSCTTGWVGCVVVVRELSSLHVALRLLRVGVFLRVLHAFWGLLRQVQVVFLLSRTVLSRVTLQCCFAWSSQCMRHMVHRIHTACMVLVFFLNSKTSVGDTEDGGRRFCVPGETKALCTSARCGVGRPAVDEFAHPQQAPLKLHE